MRRPPPWSPFLPGPHREETWFRCYASHRRRGLFIIVRVFSKGSLMRRTLREEDKILGIRGNHRGIEGQARTYKSTRFRAGRARTHSCMGVVNLHTGRLQPAIVAHEMLHIVFAWGERSRLWKKMATLESGGGPRTELEERACYALTYLLEDFQRHAQRRGYWL